jgi:hypothetical protein
MNFDVILSQWGAPGITVLIMLVAVKHLAKQLAKYQNASEKRNAEVIDQCQEDRKSLIGKIEKLQDDWRDDSRDLLVKSADALVTNARSFEQFANLVEGQTNEYRALSPKISNPDESGKKKSDRLRASERHDNE